MTAVPLPYPCYCLPGPARCDDPFNWCDRAAQEQVEQVARLIADALDGDPPDDDVREMYRRAARAVLRGIQALTNDGVIHPLAEEVS